MRAVLHDAPFVHREYHIGGHNRGKPVRYGDGRAFLHQRLKRPLHISLARRVQRRCRLVQYQDARVVQYHPCDGQPLPLAARQPVAPLSNDGIIAVRELQYAVMYEHQRAFETPILCLRMRITRLSSALLWRPGRRTSGSRAAWRETGSFPATHTLSSRASDASRMSRTSTSSILTAPSVTSYRRGIRYEMVVLPAPLGPTNAASCPGAISKLTPSSASRPVPFSDTPFMLAFSRSSADKPYCRRTSSSVILPATTSGASVTAFSASTISGSMSK